MSDGWTKWLLKTQDEYVDIAVISMSTTYIPLLVQYSLCFAEVHNKVKSLDIKFWDYFMKGSHTNSTEPYLYNLAYIWLRLKGNIKSHIGTHNS